jgi:hypothetical protein
MSYYENNPYIDRMDISIRFRGRSLAASAAVTRESGVEELVMAFRAAADLLEERLERDYVKPEPEDPYKSWAARVREDYTAQRFGFDGSGKARRAGPHPDPFGG